MFVNIQTQLNTVIIATDPSYTSQDLIDDPVQLIVYEKIGEKGLCWHIYPCKASFPVSSPSGLATTRYTTLLEKFLDPDCQSYPNDIILILQPMVLLSPSYTNNIVTADCKFLKHILLIWFQHHHQPDEATQIKHGQRISSNIGSTHKQ